jgi:hypothetical protein
MSFSSCGGARVHPGHTVVRAKCTSCHAEPERAELRNLDLDSLLEEHAQERVELDEEQARQLKAYVEQGDPVPEAAGASTSGGQQSPEGARRAP